LYIFFDTNTNLRSSAMGRIGEIIAKQQVSEHKLALA
jgi:hypothetical protein